MDLDSFRCVARSEEVSRAVSRGGRSMKVSKKGEQSNPGKKGSASRGRRHKDDRVTELLRSCLQKIGELQQSVQESDDLETDARAAGYAACALETLRFLSNEGLPSEHPVVKAVTQKLMEN